MRLTALADREGSTRPAALLRIGLALTILVRFADSMMLPAAAEPLGAAIVIAFWAGVLAMLFGWRAQAATALTALSLVAAIFYFDGTPIGWGWKHHHVHLLLAATGCLVFAPCGRSYSLDRLRAGEAAPPERGPTWAITLIAVQLTAVYFWGAVDKLSLAWLSGSKLESQLLTYAFDSDPPAIPGWGLLVQALAVGTVLTELALAIGLWFARARRWLVPVGVVFHVLVYVSMPVTVFSALSCLLYLAYYDPDQVHSVVAS